VSLIGYRYDDKKQREKRSKRKATMTDDNNNNNNHHNHDNETFVCEHHYDVQRWLDGEQQKRQQLNNLTLHPQMEKLSVTLNSTHKDTRIDALLVALSSNLHLRDIRIGRSI